MSDVTSKYGFILMESETLTGHMENLCSIASQMIWYLFSQTFDSNMVNMQLLEFFHKFCIGGGFTCLWYFPDVNPSPEKQWMAADGQEMI